MQTKTVILLKESNFIKASLIEQTLKQHGIPVYLSNVNSNAIIGGYAIGAANINVYVQEKDINIAVKTLLEYNLLDVDMVFCPKCYSLEVKKAKISLTKALKSIFIHKRITEYICANCNTNWKA